MSTAMLNVWITEIGDPCHIIKPDREERWFVHVLDCDGQVLQWCKRQYRDIPAECGHVEIELPPGCYTVLASHTAGAGEVNGVPVFGNRLTHVQIVRVNCGDHACVTLFSPTMWHCGTWFRTAVEQQRQLIARAGVQEETTKAVLQALDQFLGELPIDPFTKNMQALQEPGPADG